jgi:hypothetical protein
MSTDALRRASAAMAAVADPEGGAAVIVPSLVAGFDAPDRETRVSSAWACSLVAESAPETVGPLAHELAGRLATPGPAHDPLLRTLATLAGDADAVVREALAATTDDPDRHYAAVQDAEPWQLDDVIAQDDGGPDVPQRRLVRTDGADGGVTVSRGDATGPVDRRGGPGDPRDGPGDHRDGSGGASAGPTSGTPTPGAGDPTRTSRGGRDLDEAAQRRRRRIQRAATSSTFQRIERVSRFDDLQVVAPETERRYANVLRTRATRGTTEAGVALRLFHRPSAERHRFEAALAERLAGWAAVGDVEGVVALRDWGDDPRPWAATEYIETPLSTRDPPAAVDALGDARALSAGLCGIHQAGVVHGGIDAENVVYREDTIERPRPLLDNVALMATARAHFDPAERLDPRYAAPEYYDDAFGCVDRATDIYQLGAVVFALVAGRPPYTGSSEEVRRAITHDDPPRPSRYAEGVPAGLDDVVRKAMARRKLTRYETASQLHGDLARLCDRVPE